MRTSGVVSIAALASAASAATTCTQATITITSQAQATALACDVIKGTVVINDKTLNEVDLNGPKQVNNLIVSGAEQLVRLTSTTISSITGNFSMSDLNSLSVLEFSALEDVKAIDWVALDQLAGVSFGTEGVTSVKSVRISDTFLNSLDGLNVATVNDVDINNNRKLVTWDSDMVSVNGSMKLQNNGQGAIIVNMPKLKTCADMDIRDVAALNVPALKTVSSSMRFEGNEDMLNFTAPKLTSVSEISFTGNNQLTNISFPLLTQTGGAFTVQNNTDLANLNGFPKLETVRGALIMLGNFKSIKLPSLQNVFGQASISSTQDISKDCKFFDQLHDQQDIRGDDYKCSFNNAKANEGGDGGETVGGSDDDDNGSGAGKASASLAAVLGLAALALLI